MNKKCKHQFWKDENPPECFNCGKTKEEIYKETILKDYKLHLRGQIKEMESKCTCGCDFKDGCLCKQVREGFDKCKKDILKIIN